MTHDIHAWRSSESIYGSSQKVGEEAWKSLESLHGSGFSSTKYETSEYTTSDYSTSESIYGTIKVSDSKKSAILSCPFGNYSKVPKAGKPVSIPMVPGQNLHKSVDQQQRAEKTVARESKLGIKANGEVSRCHSDVETVQKMDNLVSSEMSLLENMVTSILRVDSDPILSEIASINSGSSGSESTNKIKENTMSLGRTQNGLGSDTKRNKTGSLTSTTSSSSEGQRDYVSVPGAQAANCGGPRSFDSGISVSDLASSHDKSFIKLNKVRRIRSLSRPKVPPPPPPTTSNSKVSPPSSPMTTPRVPRPSSTNKDCEADILSKSSTMSDMQPRPVSKQRLFSVDSSVATSQSRPVTNGLNEPETRKVGDDINVGKSSDACSSIVSNGTLKSKAGPVPPPLPPCRTSSLKRGFSLDARRRSSSARIGVSSLISSSSSRDTISTLLSAEDKRVSILKSSSVYDSPTIGKHSDCDGPTYASPADPTLIQDKPRVHRYDVPVSRNRQSREETYMSMARDIKNEDKQAMNDDISLVPVSVKRMSSFNPSSTLKDMSGPTSQIVAPAGSSLQVLEVTKKPDDVRLLPRVLASSKRTSLRRAEDPFRLSFSESHSSLSSEQAQDAKVECNENDEQMWPKSPSPPPLPSSLPPALTSTPPPPLPATSPPPLTPTSPAKQFLPVNNMGADEVKTNSVSKKVLPPLPPVRNPETKISANQNVENSAVKETSNNHNSESAVVDKTSFSHNKLGNGDTPLYSNGHMMQSAGNDAMKTQNGSLARLSKLNGLKTSSSIVGSSKEAKLNQNSTISCLSNSSAMVKHSKKSSTLSSFSTSFSSLISASSAASSKLLRASSVKELKNPLKIIDKRSGKQFTSSAPKYQITVRTNKVISKEDRKMEEGEDRQGKDVTESEDCLSLLDVNEKNNDMVVDLDKTDVNSPTPAPDVKLKKEIEKEIREAENLNECRTSGTTIIDAGSNMTTSSDVEEKKVTESNSVYSDITDKKIDLKQQTSSNLSSILTSASSLISKQTSISTSSFTSNSTSSLTSTSINSSTSTSNSSETSTSISTLMRTSASTLTSTSTSNTVDTPACRLFDSTYTISSTLSSAAADEDKTVSLLNLSQELPKTGYDFLDNW